MLINKVNLELLANSSENSLAPTRHNLFVNVSHLLKLRKCLWQCKTLISYQCKKITGMNVQTPCILTDDKEIKSNN